MLDANSTSDGEEFFATPLYFAWKRGRYRYFDGCLYVMGLLHCSGRPPLAP